MTLRRILALLTLTCGLAAVGTNFAPAWASANGDCGSYCPTPDDGHQGNGNAPQDGSVGNADDKNPPGQAPDGGDGNSGYECDKNPGVGDGNPAHTGCSPSPSPSPRPSPSPSGSPTPCPTPTTTPEPTKQPTPEPSSPAPTSVPSTPVPPTTSSPAPPAPTLTPPAPVGMGQPTQLPFTGRDVSLPAGVGAGTLVAGIALTIASRPRRSVGR